jgi:hypothetical protein
VFLTEVIWNRRLGTRIKPEIVAEREKFVQAGKTVGETEIIYLDLINVKAINQWVDRDSADAWIAFISQYGPDSVNIIES